MVDATVTIKAKPEARREQILDAACACVRRNGFHGASMHEIAQAAGLSVGQIYRYFANKEAIIAAIVAQDLAEMRERFARFENEPGAIVDSLVKHCGEGLGTCFQSERSTLVLEVLAEAARNPRVAAIVRDADRQESELKHRMLERGRKPEWTDKDVAARSEVLSALFDGLVVRSVNNPGADLEAMTPVIQSLIRRLFDAD